MNIIIDFGGGKSAGKISNESDCNRMAEIAKSEALVIKVEGRRGLKCRRSEAETNKDLSVLKADKALSERGKELEGEAD